MSRILSASGLVVLIAASTACGDSEKASGDTSDSALSNAEIVMKVLVDGVAGSSIEVVDQYVRADYVQHGSLAPDGRAGVEAFAHLEDKIQSEVHRVLSDGDFVALHSTYTLPDSTQLAGFDVYRVERGQIAEHWDAQQVLQGPNASGRTMLDGATEVSDLEATEDNRRRISEFVGAVLHDGDMSRLTEFVSADDFAQHDPRMGDGISGFETFVAEQAKAGASARVSTTHLTVANGNFVLIASDGTAGPIDDPQYALFYDLYRLQDGLIVEHWDVVPPKPNAALLPHGNGFF